MEYAAQSVGAALVVTLAGDIDTNNAYTLEDKLKSEIAAAPKQFLIDLSQVTFMSSSAVRVFVSIYRELYERGGKLRMCGLSDASRKVFQMAGMMTRIETYPDVVTGVEVINGLAAEAAGEAAAGED